jgi:hypothetical protein
LATAKSQLKNQGRAEKKITGAVANELERTLAATRQLRRQEKLETERPK